MKQYLSKTLRTIALLFLGYPIVYILGAAIVFNLTADSCVSALLSPFYYVVTFSGVGVGHGIREGRRWAWYLFLVFSGLVIYENAILVNTGESHHKILAFLFSVLIQLMLLFQVAREVRVPYFFPRIRWWESNPRYRLTVPVKIARQEGLLEGEILDLSVGGCFVKLRYELNQDEPVQVQFRVFGHDLDCRGMVVWRTQSTVTHPKGIGVKFDHVPRSQKRTLRIITKRLRAISAFYGRSRYLMNQDDFLKHLEELEAKMRA